MNILLENFSVIGRLVKDAEIIESGLRKAIVFPVAVNHSYKDEKGEMVKHTNFYDTAKWYNNDVGIEKQLSFLKKGVLVAIEGFPKARGYMSKENKIEAKITITVSQYSVLNFVNNAINNNDEVPTEELVDESEEELIEEYNMD